MPNEHCPMLAYPPSFGQFCQFATLHAGAALCKKCQFGAVAAYRGNHFIVGIELRPGDLLTPAPAGDMTSPAGVSPALLCC